MNNDTDLAELVIRELVRHHSVNDITLTVCKKAKLPWNEAERFVRRIQTERHQEIARRQSPLLKVFAGASSLIGFGLSVSMIILTVLGISIHSDLFGIPIPYFGNAIGFGTGFVLVIGGIEGFRKLRAESSQTR